MIDGLVGGLRWASSDRGCIYAAGAGGSSSWRDKMLLIAWSMEKLEKVLHCSPLAFLCFSGWPDVKKASVRYNTLLVPIFVFFFINHSKPGNLFFSKNKLEN
jgi:hypothetical protein